MSSEKDFDRIFKALSDARRRRILDLLKTRPRTTGEICLEFLELDRCTVMQHLDVLEAARLLVQRKEGRYRWNYLDVVPLREIYERWIDPLTSHAVGVLSRLRHDLENQ
jgi:DNA-binding transcriptional ArsR family regulator